jgi:hypothetical protein
MAAGPSALQLLLSHLGLASPTCSAQYPSRGSRLRSAFWPNVALDTGFIPGGGLPELTVNQGDQVRRLKMALGAILLLAVPVTIAAAQTSVPTVAVTHARGSTTLEGSGPIGAGPTRFTYSGRGQFNLVTLRPGVTLDQLRATLSRNEEAALGLLFLEASAGPGRALTVDLRPNTTYVVGGGAGRSAALTSFTTGAPTGAQAPRPDSRIRMVDYGFRGPATLPRNGTIRVQNEGTTFHFALAFPLRPGVAERQVGRAFRGGNERAMRRVVGGPPVTVQDLISQGTTNDNEVRFARRGRYAMVCFFGEHNRLGMYRVYRVR